MPIDGSWNIVAKSPMGDQKSTLNAQSQGSTFTGVMGGSGGQSEIENGKIDGDQVSWSRKISVPMPLTLEFSGKLEGDSITGIVRVGGFGKSPFTAVRA